MKTKPTKIKKVTDRVKIEGLALLFGNTVETRGLSSVIGDRRYTFDENGDLVKVQAVETSKKGVQKYVTLSEAQP